MHEGWTFWLAGGLAAFLIGLSKTGVPGLGILAVPLMAWIFPVRLSVGALLPILIVGDVAALLFFRRHADLAVLRRLAPWTLVGMGAGAWVLLKLDDTRLEPLLGSLILLLVLLELARTRVAWLNVPHHRAFTALSGALTGFATTIGNVAGPVMNLFMVGQGIAKQAFMGTVAWFFLLINLSKVPLFAHLDMITAETLRFDLWMLVPALAGGLVGRRLLHALSDRAFHVLILLLAAAAGLRLVWC